MDEYPVFPNAPIMEALLDIQVTLPSHVTIDKLAAIQNPIRDRFPDSRVHSSFQVGFQAGVDGAPAPFGPSGGPDGHLFQSLDEGKVVQVRLNGLTFSKLKPYENWATFRDEAHSLWNLYAEAAQPTTVTRIALRYINRLEIPLPITDFKDYLNTTPEIAQGLPQGLLHYFMRLVIPHPSWGIFGVVTQTMEAIQVDSEKLGLIFDIDVFRQENYSPDDPKVWEVLEQLRVYKDEIFFKSITEKARSLFQ